MNEYFPENAAALENQPRKLRILALHGFAQNADHMCLKMQKLKDLLTVQFACQYPGGVEMVCPDGPVKLSNDDSPCDWRAWWRTLDDKSLFDELPNSLQDLVHQLRRNPVDGVIGFSQGATMAMMLASLCEGTFARSHALATQGSPIHIPALPQQPFKFVVAYSGWRANPKFYKGFYRPKITTPVLHVVAALDHLISLEGSSTLIKTCRDPEVLTHRGGHWVPTDPLNMRIVADFVVRAVNGSYDGDSTPDLWEYC